jgi:hypothetical protein
MAVHQGIGTVTSLTTSATSARTGAIAHQSDSLRFVAKSQGHHVAIGTLPTGYTTSYYIPSGGESILSIGRPASQRVVNVIVGTATTIDFPEGTGSPFAVGDAVTLTVTGQSSFDFEHKIVSSVDTSAGVGGYYNTRITVDHDSSSVSDAFNPAYAELRGSLMVAARTDSGSGTLYIQQVQVTGQA